MKNVFYIAALAIFTASLYQFYDPFDVCGAVLKSLIELTIYSSSSESIELLREYDFIIVGAGTAGCVLANRLTENPNWQVLLIEAGPDENVLMDVPVLTYFLQMSKQINWHYKTERNERNENCAGMVNGQCNWPRGKVMGGSSVLNFMIYTRGNRRDFDRWAEMVDDPSWNYSNVRQYFEKLENLQTGDAPAAQPHKGPVTVSNIKFTSIISETFLKAAQQLGIPTVNYNGFNQFGVSRLQVTTKNGYRMSSNRAYVTPIRHRKNLHIQTASQVTRILIDEKRKQAIGVEFRRKNEFIHAMATKEVILSAGAINSPQLLMLSGIGSADHLLANHIEPIVNRPAVGENLMDHASPEVFHISTNTTSRIARKALHLGTWMKFFREGTGFASLAAGCEVIAFLDSTKNVSTTQPDAYPDLEIVELTGAFRDCSDSKVLSGYTSEVFDRLYTPLKDKQNDIFSLFVIPLRPRSRGYIRLRNTDPFSHPVIYPNYYADEYDLNVSYAGIRKMQELLKTKAFLDIDAKLLKRTAPACERFEYDTDRYWECQARHLTVTCFHYTGTCKMGRHDDPTAVVDARLKVIGVSGLRVVDGSIMPEIVSGHPNSAIFMIAEKASDMIKEDWRLRAL